MNALIKRRLLNQINSHRLLAHKAAYIWLRKNIKSYIYVCIYVWKNSFNVKCLQLAAATSAKMSSE